jgi:hypothetical protein
VKRLNIYGFYDCGRAIQVLEKAAEHDSLLSDVAYPCLNALLWLDFVLATDSLALQVVRAPGETLKERILEMWKKAREASQDKDATNKDKERSRVSFTDGYAMGEAIREFQTVLSAELRLADAYVVAKKGIYSTADLIDRAENALSAELRAVLPHQSIVDFREAGKCLALDLFTGSGFHVLRATDAVLRKYYEHFVGTPPKPKMRNWGAYTRVLRKCFEEGNLPKPDEKTVSLIDSIREMRRNPIIHPEDNLDEDKALILFDVCKSAIVAMGVEIKEVAAMPPKISPTLMCAKLPPLQEPK